MLERLDCGKALKACRIITDYQPLLLFQSVSNLIVAKPRRTLFTIIARNFPPVNYFQESLSALIVAKHHMALLQHFTPCLTFAFLPNLERQNCDKALKALQNHGLLTLAYLP
jgi:hypothetical protein